MGFLAWLRRSPSAEIESTLDERAARYKERLIQDHMAEIRRLEEAMEIENEAFRRCALEDENRRIAHLPDAAPEGK